jgi:hypothetical protein
MIAILIASGNTIPKMLWDRQWTRTRAWATSLVWTKASKVIWSVAWGRSSTWSIYFQHDYRK